MARARALLARGISPREIAVLYRTTRTGTQLQAALAATPSLSLTLALGLGLGLILILTLTLIRTLGASYALLYQFPI